MPTHYLKAEQLPAWSAYAVMKLDHAASGRAGGNGVLESSELRRHVALLEGEVEGLEGRRHLGERERERLEVARAQLADAWGLLRDLDTGGATGLVYLPDDLLTRFCDERRPEALVDLQAADLGAVAARIPDHLRRRAAELLFIDDKHRFGRLTPEVLHHARARYEHMDPRVAVSMVRSREVALREIDELARLLGHPEVARA